MDPKRVLLKLQFMQKLLIYTHKHTHKDKFWFMQEFLGERG